MIGGLLLILLAILGTMQAPVWAVPVVAVMLAGLCSTAPALRRRMALPVLWAAVLAACMLAYGVGYAMGLALLP
jgi:hypothetical protein